MHIARLDHLLAGTAIALALTLGSYGGSARAESDATISAAVPMPDTADIPPPTISDIMPSASQTAPAPAAEIKSEAPASASSAETTRSVPEAAATTYVTASVADTALVDKL